MHSVGPLNYNNGRASLITSILHIKYSASSTARGFGSDAFQKMIYFSRRFMPADTVFFLFFFPSGIEEGVGGVV